MLKPTKMTSKARTQPKSRNSPEWLSRMHELVGQGRLAAAVAEYEEHARSAPYEAQLLRARIYLKKFDARAARALLQSAQPPERDDVARAQHAMLTGTAHTMDGRFDVADEELARAEVILTQLGNQELDAELAFRRAQRYAVAGDVKRAASFLAAAKRTRTLDGIINATFVESYLLASQERFAEQAEVNISLLERIDPSDTSHDEARFFAAWNVAALARELWIPHAIALVERHVNMREWPADYTTQRFQSLKAIGWCHALQGDYFNAFRCLKRALEASQHGEHGFAGDARRCIAHLDRAYLARSNNERIFERQELEEAENLAARVNWGAVQGEDRVALLLLAELFAPIDSGKATYYSSAFDGLPKSAHPWHHFSRDERLDHLANYSRAVVDIAAGHTKSAAALLRKAYAYYERIQYSWRAGRCALRLHDITRDDRWLERAREMLRNYSGSWLGQEIRALASPANTIFTPMQQKVFAGICRGLSNAQIAAEAGRSEFTIRNHVKLVFKALGVTSRSALIAEALRRGLL